MLVSVQALASYSSPDGNKLKWSTLSTEAILTTFIFLAFISEIRLRRDGPLNHFVLLKINVYILWTKGEEIIK